MVKSAGFWKTIARNGKPYVYFLFKETNLYFNTVTFVCGGIYEVELIDIFQQ